MVNQMPATSFPAATLALNGCSDLMRKAHYREANIGCRAENLCLYGMPDGQWAVDLPAEEVPPEMPEPSLGYARSLCFMFAPALPRWMFVALLSVMLLTDCRINFSRAGMQVSLAEFLKSRGVSYTCACLTISFSVACSLVADPLYIAMCRNETGSCL